MHDGSKAVVYNFTDSRSGENARAFLGHDPDRRERGQPPWTGYLVCDDFSGYKALFTKGVIEVGCMAHARRKFVELHVANESTLAAQAIGQLYGVERNILGLTAEDRLAQRRSRAAPAANALHEWLIAQRARVTNGTATAKAIDYSLNRWAALTRYLDDPRLPIDKNHYEQQALGGRAQELAVRRNAGCRPTGGRDYKLDPVGRAERPRYVCPSEGCAGAVADAARQPDRCAAAASMDAASLSLRTADTAAGQYGLADRLVRQETGRE